MQMPLADLTGPHILLEGPELAAMYGQHYQHRKHVADAQLAVILESYGPISAFVSFEAAGALAASYVRSRDAVAAVTELVAGARAPVIGGPGSGLKASYLLEFPDDAALARAMAETMGALDSDDTGEEGMFPAASHTTDQTHGSQGSLTGTEGHMAHGPAEAQSAQQHGQLQPEPAHSMRAAAAPFFPSGVLLAGSSGGVSTEAAGDSMPEGGAYTSNHTAAITDSINASPTASALPPMAQLDQIPKASSVAASVLWQLNQLHGRAVPLTGQIMKPSVSQDTHAAPGAHALGIGEAMRQPMGAPANGNSTYVQPAVWPASPPFALPIRGGADLDPESAPLPPLAMPVTDGSAALAPAFHSLPAALLTNQASSTAAAGMGMQVPAYLQAQHHMHSQSVLQVGVADHHHHQQQHLQLQHVQAERVDTAITEPQAGAVAAEEDGDDDDVLASCLALCAAD